MCVNIKKIRCFFIDSKRFYNLSINDKIGSSIQFISDYCLFLANRWCKCEPYITVIIHTNNMWNKWTIFAVFICIIYEIIFICYRYFTCWWKHIFIWFEILCYGDGSWFGVYIYFIASFDEFFDVFISFIIKIQFIVE